jgi:DNA-binding NarL/FixJ family response regulator
MFNIFSNPEKSKPRILIVENDPIARISYQTLLTYWDYEPVLAMGTGLNLLADAKTKASEKRCALALIDLRLIDDYDEQDISGLKFADEMGDILRPIILSGHDNPNLLRTMLQKHTDLTFISKNDNRKVFQEMLDADAEKVTASKRKLVFENPVVLNEILNSSLGQQTGGYPDQIADVLARLFPNAKKLSFEKLELRSLSSNISTVPRPNSVVMKVYEEDYEPYVVKIARSEKIKKEVENYKKHIFRKLTDGFTARLERSTVLWDIGGISYSYIGSFDVKTFSSFYEEKPIAEIEESLRSFFGVTWSRHYERAQEVNNASLFKLYSNVWGDWYKKSVKAFPSINPVEFNLVHKELNPPNPIEWIKTQIVENPNDLSCAILTRVAITHGDLHGDNLLVDSKKIPWVIDFERCGEGHVLQDFIELEADIINRLEAHNENISAYFKMYMLVLKQKKIRGFERLEIASITSNERIEKALKTISILRSLAFQHTGISDAREYLFGLLFNTVFRATIAHDKFPHKDENRTLMLASIICHRIDHWDVPWPPLEWEKLLGFEQIEMAEEDQDSESPYF